MKCKIIFYKKNLTISPPTNPQQKVQYISFQYLPFSTQSNQLKIADFCVSRVIYDPTSTCPVSVRLDSEKVQPLSSQRGKPVPNKELHVPSSLNINIGGILCF
jgi:hypothetical protein